MRHIQYNKNYAPVEICVLSYLPWQNGQKEYVSMKVYDHWENKYIGGTITMNFKLSVNKKKLREFSIEEQAHIEDLVQQKNK